MNKKQGQQEFITYGIIAFVVLIALFLSVYTVKAGYRGVVLTFGKPSETVAQEGIHIKFPIAQTVKKMEVRTQKIETMADSASLDLQDVQTTIALNFHLKPDSVNSLYQQIGKNYKERIIDPAIQESVKATTAKFSAEELITRRPEVRDGIKRLLTEKLSKYYITVDDFNIVNFQFSEVFDKAIEEKMVAEQKKLEAERILERIKIEKEQKITQAQAEAEALRLQKLQVTDELIKLREIEVRRKALEVQEKAIEKWDGILPKVTGGATPFINFETLKDEETRETKEE